MEEKIKNANPYLFDPDLIPDRIRGVELDSLQKDRLARGLPSGYIDHIHFKELETISSGRIRLVYDKEKNTLVVHYDLERERLEMPDSVIGVKLDEALKETLLKGQTLTINRGGSDYFIHVDMELKSVKIARTSEVGIPDSIGGYYLTTADKHLLANSRSIGLRAYEQDGRYFAANVSMTSDRTGLSFTDIKALSKEAFDKMKAELNDPGFEDTLKTLIHYADRIREESLKESAESEMSEKVAGWSLTPDGLKKGDRVEQDLNRAVGSKVRTRSPEASAEKRVGAVFETRYDREVGFVEFKVKKGKLFVKDSFWGHRFTDSEKESLEAGRAVHINDAVTKSGKKVEGDLQIHKDKNALRFKFSKGLSKTLGKAAKKLKEDIDYDEPEL